MTKYECRVCGREFEVFRNYKDHKKTAHISTLDEFGLEMPEFERPESGKDKDFEQTDLSQY